MAGRGKEKGGGGGVCLLLWPDARQESSSVREVALAVPSCSLTGWSSPPESSFSLEVN